MLQMFLAEEKEICIPSRSKTVVSTMDVSFQVSITFIVYLFSYFVSSSYVSISLSRSSLVNKIIVGILFY